MGSITEQPVLLPVIDISGPQAEVANELVDAAATYGFVYVKSEGKDIPVEAIDNTFQLVRFIRRPLFDFDCGAKTVVSRRISLLPRLKKSNHARSQKM